jgi:hypothetical protein
VQGTLFGQQLLRARLVGLRGCERGFDGNRFAAELGEFAVALLELLPQFVFQSLVRWRDRLFPARHQRADEPAEAAADNECNSELSAERHG